MILGRDARVLRRPGRGTETTPAGGPSWKNLSATITSEAKLPILLTPLPGPKAREVIARDAQFVSPSYTRGYPLVAKSGRGAMVEDVDGNMFLDFAAGIAVVSTGHCHPRVVEAIQKQAAELIHISCTDFYYQGLVELAERLCRGGSRQRGEESLFRQLGHGSHRSGHQAGALPHAPRQDHRVPRLLSRAHARRAFAHRVQGRAAQGIRRAAGRRVSHSLSEFLSLPVRQSFALHVRRIGDVSGARNLQAPGRSRRSGGDFHRADSGRRRIRSRAEGISRRVAAHLPEARNPSRVRRSAERHGTHREMVGQRPRRNRAGHSVRGEGHRLGHAAFRDDCAREPDGLEAGRARFDLRRQSRVRRRGARDDGFAGDAIH